MRRGLSLIAGAALLAVSAPVSALHVHVYDAHDHEEHHHGPAAHSHAPGRASGASSHHGVPIAKACDPGGHVLSLVFTCVQPAPHGSDPVVVPTAAWSDPAPEGRPVSAPRDVRAHSPPRLTDAPVRAPPAVHPA